MTIVLVRVLIAFVVGLKLMAQPVSLSKADASEGWLLLFDGQTLFGWSSSGKARWQASGGILRAEGSDAGSLRTNSQFGDMVMQMDYRATGRGAIYLRVPRDKDLSAGHEVELGGANTKAAGDPAAWHRLEIETKGESFHVKVDGRELTARRGQGSRSGSIGLMCARGAKVEFRNIRLKPLGLEALYNGSNMDGWKLVTPASADKPRDRRFLKVIPLGSSKTPAAQWSVRGGAIHVERGEGQLETAAAYDDFVLQMEVRSNDAGDSATTGIALRGDPGQMKSGYTIQFETGGIPALQSARKVPVDKKQFYTKTIVASGRHLAVWIDGRLVTDFEDQRPPGANTTREARLGKGPVALRVDRDTNADFRNIRIMSLSGAGSAEAAKVAKASTPATPPAPGGGTVPPVSAAVPVAPAEDQDKDDLIAQQIAQQQMTQQQDAQKQQQVSQLMQQGLSTSSPAEQIRIYTQILAIDPNNQVAYNARKEAEQKVEQKKAEDAKMQQEHADQQRNQVGREETKRRALQNAEQSLLRGDLSVSRAEAEIARKIAPDDPEVRRMLNLLDSRLQARSRLRYMLLGTGSFGFLAGATLFIRRLRNRRPVLEVLDGSNKGDEFEVKEEVTRIGAIAQDGGGKNDVVLDDPQRSISRFHCEIHNIKGKIYVVDHGSSNGTYIDGAKLKAGKPALIRRRSRIRLGHTCTMKLAYRGRK